MREKSTFDLERVKEQGATDLDYERVMALSNYLAEIHAVVKNDCPPLYQRKIRETVGSGECIFGILDDYPDNPNFLDPDELQDIEKICVEWRWMLRTKPGASARCMATSTPEYNVSGGRDFSVLT